MCWHVYKKSMLVIDGKNNNNDGMSTGNNNNNFSMLIVIDGKNNNDEGMVTGKNSSDVGRFTVRRQQWKTCRKGRSTSMMAWEYQKRKLHFRVSDIGSWRSQESRLFITGVPKLRNAKCRNPETCTSIKSPFRSFRYRELEESRFKTLHHRSLEVAECETPKS